jgi:hypothetical protein
MLQHDEGTHRLGKSDLSHNFGLWGTLTTIRSLSSSKPKYCIIENNTELYSARGKMVMVERERD